MKEYEVSIYTRANSSFKPNLLICSFVISAANKKQAREFAYELYCENEETPYSETPRFPISCLKIEVECLN